MTPKQVLDYFGNCYYFSKKTGMSHNSLANWIKKGNVPLNSQVKLQKLTNGDLKAEFPEGL